MGVPPNHPFLDGIVPNKNHPFLGYPYFKKPPYIIIYIYIIVLNEMNKIMGR